MFWYISRSTDFIIKSVVIAVTLATLIYGVVSWCIMKKFRTYRNYVFLNAILSNFLYCVAVLWRKRILRSSDSIGWKVFSYFFLTYVSTAKCFWLVVINHMFYVDLVKVFDTHVQRRNLKSSIFGWGVSLITTAIYTYLRYYNYFRFPTDYMAQGNLLVRGTINLIAVYGLQIIPLAVNCLMYLIIIFSLCRSFISSAHPPSYIWRHLYIATLIFVLSDILLLYDYFIKNLLYYTMPLEDLRVQVATVLIKLFTKLSPLILDIFLIVLKSNRKLWYELYVKRMNQRQRGRDIVMRDRIACQPFGSHPAVLDDGKFKYLPDV